MCAVMCAGKCRSLHTLHTPLSRGQRSNVQGQLMHMLMRATLFTVHDQGQRKGVTARQGS